MANFEVSHHATNGEKVFWQVVATGFFYVVQQVVTISHS